MKISYIIFFSLTFMIFRQVYTDKHLYALSTGETIKIVKDLPGKKELDVYVLSLNKLLKYILRNTKCIDFGMKFGLFVLDANLRRFLAKNELPQPIRSNLTNLLDQSNALQKIYHLKLRLLRSNITDLYDKATLYNKLLNDGLSWSLRIKKLNTNLLKEIYSNNVPFPSWKAYEEHVSQVVTTAPDAVIFDTCLSALSQNEEGFGDGKLCDIPKSCVAMFDTGTNYGYALLSKLLFLLLSEYSRGCTIFSTNQDEHAKHLLCKSAFKESEYIAKNGFQKIDIIAEHIGLCTLDGHAQFIRKSWLSRIIKHQTPYGYFRDTVLSFSNKMLILIELRKTNGTKLKEDMTCYQHINAVAVTALAAAIRYILENCG